LRLGSDGLKWADPFAGGESKQNMNHELTAGGVDKHRHTNAQCQSQQEHFLNQAPFSYLRTVLLAFAALSQQPICGLIAGSASASLKNKTSSSTALEPVVPVGSCRKTLISLSSASA